MPEASDALRSQFAPTGTLRIGLNMRNGLLTRTDAETGEPLGVAHDLGRELGRRLGLPVAMRPYPNPGELMEAASRDEWDVTFLAAEPQRARKIDFTGAYVEIEATYLVPPGSKLRRVEEVDAEGVRIIAPDKAAYELYLTRTLEHAVLDRAPGADAALERFVEEGFDALAGLHPRLLADEARLAGARILEGRFTAVQQAAGVPRGRPEAAEYLSAFIEDIRASGLVAKAIEDNEVVGLTVVSRA